MLKKEKNKNIFGETNTFKKSDNIFDSLQNNSATSIPMTKQKMINDFDSALILENIDKNVKNKAVKINLKIKTLEKELDKITEQLELIKLLNLEKDKSRKEKLEENKKYIENQLNNLIAERKNFGIYYSIIAFINSKIDIAVLKEKIIESYHKSLLFTKKLISYIDELHQKSSSVKW